VADVAALNPKPGARYIWEGIKVAKFSLDKSVISGTAVAGKLQKVNPSLQVQVNAATNTASDTIVSLSGGNLFVAYRVVEFSVGKPAIIARMNFSHRNEIDLGSDYRVVFKTISKADSVWIGDNRYPQLMFPNIVKRSRCAGLMFVSNVVDLDASGNPRTGTWGMTCTGGNGEPRPPDMGDYSLGLTKHTDGYVMDTLKVTKLEPAVRRDKLNDIEEYSAKGEFQLERRTLELVSYAMASAPGW
jgi:hypothetical protein